MGRKKKAQVLKLASCPEPTEVDMIFAESRSLLKDCVVIGDIGDELLVKFTSSLTAQELLWYAKQLEMIALEVITVSDIESMEE